MNKTSEKFDLWCIVELFGHSRIAGRCTEQNVAGTNMLRVDVPETKHQPPFTRLLGSAAIYAINPVTKEVATAYAEQLQSKPIDSYDIRKMQDKLLGTKQVTGPVYDDDTDDDSDFL